MGAAAALKSDTGTIGFIGGVETPLILKFQAGFEAGALAANPDIEILPAVYLTQVPDFTGFNDPVKGNEAARGLYGQGADVIFHAAGGSGLGLFQAAAELSTDDSSCGRSVSTRTSMRASSAPPRRARAPSAAAHPDLDAERGRRRT